MPSYHIEKSIVIDVPESQVRSAVGDFNEWPKWSPWLCMEPDARLNFVGTPLQVGHGYDWEGELVGSGKMEIEKVGQNFEMDLEFFKPFKSKGNKVLMEITPQSESSTKVTWHMDSKLPFFLFFMVDMMKTMIGMDYSRGLKMLKAYLETGSVNSHIEINGVVDFAGCEFVGVQGQGKMEQLGKEFESTLPQAHCLATDNNLEMIGGPGTLYDDTNLKTQECVFTSLIPVKRSTELAGGVAGKLLPSKAVKVTHRGSYDFLGNGWSAAMSYQRSKKLKQLKKQSPFEFYLNDPDEVAESEILTEIFIPIKG